MRYDFDKYENANLTALLDSAEQRRLLRRGLEKVLEECDRLGKKELAYCIPHHPNEWRCALYDAIYSVVLDNHLSDEELEDVGRKLIDENCKRGFRLTEKEILAYISHNGIPELYPPHYDFNSLYATANAVWSAHATGKDRIDFGECAPTEYRIVDACVTKAVEMLTGKTPTAFNVRRLL